MASLIDLLDEVSEQLWEIHPDDAQFEQLKKRCSQLAAQIAVQHALQKTVRLALTPTIPTAQSRISKFLETLYSDTEQANARWQLLRDLDCQTFLLIAASYTPLEITKMSRVEFDYLLQNAAPYSMSKSLSPNWIFRKEIQLAIVEKSDLPNIRSFKKRYHDLEFDDPPRKKRCVVAEQVDTDEGMCARQESNRSPSCYSSTEIELAQRNIQTHSAGLSKRSNGPSQTNWESPKDAPLSGDKIVSHVLQAPVPHSVLDLTINDLVMFLGRFQNNCPDLKMTCPWLGVPLPYIDIPLEPSNSIIIKIELSLEAGEALLQYVLRSRGVPAHISH